MSVFSLNMTTADMRSVDPFKIMQFHPVRHQPLQCDLPSTSKTASNHHAHKQSISPQEELATSSCCCNRLSICLGKKNYRERERDASCVVINSRFLISCSQVHVSL